jgi:type II secretory pathway pseudopilin PulG
VRSPGDATTSTAARRGEAGFTIIEVLVAALILTLASAALFGVLAAATRNGARVKATQIALDRAQQEMEKLHSLNYDELALTKTPPSSSNPNSPNHRIVNGKFALQREPASEYAPIVAKNGEIYGGGFIEGGVVNPGPIAFEEGDVKGHVYRYIVWRNDKSCPESETGEDLCPGSQDYKQLVVAVKLDATGTEPRERGYVEVQSAALDPESVGAPSGSKELEEEEATRGTGTSVTAQQFFLTDTPCSASGSTSREEIAGDHLLHNTLGTCASGLQTSTLGAPDALLLGAPPDPDPEDESNPALYDYSSDSYLETTPEADKGLRIMRDSTAGCHHDPTGTVHPGAQAHRWVTDPFSANFNVHGKVTLEFYTRTATVNEVAAHGTLCVYLFDRHETGTGEATKATNFWFENKNATGNPAYWTYTPEGNGFWPKGAWTKVRLSMEILGAPRTILAGDRLGVGLSVDLGNTDAETIPIMYDHPNYPSRIEVDTTTPAEGG